MLARVIGHGLLTPFRRPGLTVLLWGFGFALVFVPAAVLSRWLEAALDTTMASDPMLHGIDLTVLAQIGQYDRSPVGAIVASSMAATLLVGALVGPLVAGGTLEVLAAGDSRSLMHRFFRGAGHFYWRYFRLGLMAAGVAGLTVLGVSLALSPVARVAADAAWEPAGPIAIVGLVLLYGLVIVFWWLALDYARIRVALDGSHVMWRALLDGTRFVLRRLAAVAAIVLPFGLALALLAGFYLAWTGWASFATTAAIALLFVVQQTIVLARHGLRLGQLDAQLAYWRAMHPVPVVVATPATPPAPEPSPAEFPASGWPASEPLAQDSSGPKPPAPELSAPEPAGTEPPTPVPAAFDATTGSHEGTVSSSREASASHNASPSRDRLPDPPPATGGPVT